MIRKTLHFPRVNMAHKHHFFPHKLHLLAESAFFRSFCSLESGDTPTNTLKPLNNKLPKKTKRGTVREVLNELNDDDLVEEFIRGSGKGGQKINKTSSAIFLKHIPTGISVKCQKTRSQALNRREARKILALKLDAHFNEQTSYIEIQKQMTRKRNNKKKSRSRKKYQKLAEQKRQDQEDVGIEQVQVLDDEDTTIMRP